MDKAQLHQSILLALEKSLVIAEKAALQAYDTATNSESVAENKYDTFGLEASYLAAGQSKRVEQCASDIELFKKLKPKHFNDDDTISIGALVSLNDINNQKSHFFLSPVSGGLKVNHLEIEFSLITTSTPLGKLLIDRTLGEEFELVLGNKSRQYEIVNIQ